MKVDHKERTIIVTNRDLTDPVAANVAMVHLYSVMAFPGDAVERELFNLGMLEDTFKHYSDEVLEKAFHNSPYLAVRFFRYQLKARKVFERSFVDREESGIGTPFKRGAIAGELLCHLMDPSGKRTMTRSYDDCRARLFNGSGGEFNISKSSLVAIWRKFRGVAHFWAAYHLYKTQNIDGMLFVGLPTCSAPDPKAAEHFSRFLKISSYFREWLDAAKNAEKINQLIIDGIGCHRVWRAKAEDGSPIPALDPLIEEWIPIEKK